MPKMLDVQGNRYAAVAAVHHIGASVDEGHYYAAVRGEDDSWLIVNDSVITAMEAEKFLNVQDAGRNGRRVVLRGSRESFGRWLTAAREH